MGRRLRFATLAIAAWCSRAEEVSQIQSLARNGELTWTGTATTGNYRVEWAPTAAGPWSSSWQALTNIPATGAATTLAVPMFYRVVYTPPPPPVFSNVTASAALSLITNRSADVSFVILDVRTPSEFNPRHVRTAKNLNFFATDFATQLATLDRKKAYLVYCASGNRSGQAVEQMKTLGFLEVYNLTGGFGGLAALPDAPPWLEP